MKLQHKYVCPVCREKSGVNIIYGMPGYDLFLAEERGEVVLGGCVIDLDDPDRQCLQCGHAWRIKRRSISLPDSAVILPKGP